MKQKLHSLLLMVVLLSWSMVIAASDFDDGILKYTITSPSNLEVQCDGLNTEHWNDEVVSLPSTVNYNNKTYTVTTVGCGLSGTSFSENLKSILLPNSIVQINSYCFYYCHKLMEINIPSSVTSIGDNAFNGCSGLTSIDIPSSVTSIGVYAFGHCSSLTSLVIPSSVTSIGDYAFYGCSGLTSINIPSSVTSIGDSAFSGCSGLTSIDIPSCVTSINGLFANCSGLTSINIPSSVTSIGNNAFSGCSGLTSIDIPSSVTSIGDNAFSGCSGLTSLVIPSSVTSIGNYAFTGCTDLASLELSYGITRIGTDAFKNCTSLESIEIPNSVKELRAGCLSYCSSLKNIVLSTSIDVIYPYLFAGCSALKSIEIPASVQIIWASVFYKCTDLKNIICNSTKAPTFVQITLGNGPCKETLCEPTLAPQITLVTPKGAVGYTEAPWSYFKAPEALRLTDENASLDAGAYPIGSLTYSRSNMTSGSYATFCLPFDTNLSEVSDAFENVYTANQTALYKPDGKLILLLQKIDKDASISAGQPFVAKLKDNVTEVTFSNNKLMTVDSDIMQNGTPTPLHVFDWDGTSGLLTENTDIKVSYGGALSTMTGVGSEYETFNSNGTFGPTKGGQVKAFRAYVLKEDAVTQGRVKSISFGIEGNDGTTNIETIVDSPEKNTDKMVYSIDGRLVNTTGSVIGLPSGIYIKNHQKIYVK